VTDLQSVLDALASPVRREILWRLWDEELPAGAVAAAFDVTAPTISEHLGVLRRAGLVTMRRSGNHRLYRTVRDAVRGVQVGLAGEGERWLPREGLPERDLAHAATAPAVLVGVELDVDPGTAFTAFTDPDLYSRWLGSPVRIEGGRFSCTLEWGTEVRGRYEVVAPPSLIAMRWAFSAGGVPVPGQDLVGYLRVEEAGHGSRVEVHQLVETDEQAAFMAAAWRFVLGRLRQRLPAALEGRGRAPGSARAE
jgi:DNA-binding transcriptional ArsR family regulator